MAQVDHPSGTLRTGNVSDELAKPPGILTVNVVSPAKPIYDGDARWVTIRAWDGQMGIWPGHTDIVAALGAGLLRIGHPDGSIDRFAIWGGFLKVGKQNVTVLVDRAVAEQDVVAEDAKNELSETLEKLQHPKSAEEFEQLQEQRRWCQTRIHLAG